MSIKRWIWQHDLYPSFLYNYKALDLLLTQVSHNIGLLKGKISALNNSDTDSIQIDTITNEIIASSKIEGEILSRDSVRSSVCKKFDNSFNLKDKSTHHTDNLVEILIDSSFNHKPLTKNRLHSWHGALFPTGYSGLIKIKVAKFRDEEMSIVSNRGYREKTHYQAPPPNEIDKQIDKFLNYINNSNDNAFIKSAIAHLWFVIIHPYDDGNGRIARAITNYILSKELGLEYKYFSISTAVINDKKSYYEILEKTNRLHTKKAYDFTEWILWHTNMLNSATLESVKNIDTVVKKTKFWDKAREFKLNEKQIKVLNKLLDAGENGFKGGLTNKKYRSITNTTQITASRHIKDLVNKNLLKETQGYGGRSTRYEINWE